MSFKLNPRKPDIYLLEDLANLTLEIDTALASYWQGLTDPNNSWHQTKKLGAVHLDQLTEWSHEKHTEVYSQTAFVPYNELDYGQLINQNVSNCVAVSGTSWGAGGSRTGGGASVRRTSGGSIVYRSEGGEERSSKDKGGRSIIK